MRVVTGSSPVPSTYGEPSCGVLICLENSDVGNSGVRVRLPCSPQQWVRFRMARTTPAKRLVVSSTLTLSSMQFDKTLPTTQEEFVTLPSVTRLGVTMKKVKIIEGCTINELEDNINSFLASVPAMEKWTFGGQLSVLVNNRHKPRCFIAILICD